MTDLLEEVEGKRLKLRLSQSEVAEYLAVSQGHYSKVMARKAPLTRKVAARMREFLVERVAVPATDAKVALEKCMELMHFLRGLVEVEPVDQIGARRD